MCPIPLLVHLEGKIHVYSMRFFPFIQKERMVLKPKGIWPEIINLNLKNKPGWFFKKN